MFGAHDGVVTPGSLRDVALFEGFSDEALRRVAELAEPVAVDDGHVLVEQGRVGLACYIVMDGHADVYVGDERVADVSAGAPVGEMALLGHLPRVATVVADGPMHLIAFDIAGFRALLQEMPRARERLEATMQERSERVRQARRGASAPGEGNS